VSQLRSPALALVASILPELIDADALCQTAEDAIEQDKASSMVDALVVARHAYEMAFARAIDRAMSEALDRHIAPRSIEQIAAEQAEVVPHITAAQYARDSRVLREIGAHLRKAGE